MKKKNLLGAGVFGDGFFTFIDSVQPNLHPKGQQSALMKGNSSLLSSDIHIASSNSTLPKIQPI